MTYAIERAMLRGSRERFEHRLLRLVESAENPEPQEPTTIAEAEEAVRWAQTSSSEYDRAVATLTKL